MTPEDKRPLGQPPEPQTEEKLPGTAPDYNSNPGYSNPNPNPNTSSNPYGPIYGDTNQSVPPSTPMPNFAERPIVIGGNSSKPRRGKKALLLAGLLLLLLVGGGAAAYAYYSQPSKVVADALSNAAFSETLAAKGVATIKSQDDNGDFTINYNVTGSDQDGYKAGVQVKANVAPVSIDVSGEFINSKEGDLYFKIDKAKEILQNIFGASNPDALKQYENLIALVDNKWVKVTASELGDSSLDSECYIKLENDIKANKSIADEAKKAYADNQFFVVDKTLNSESIGGVDSIHYKMKLDEAKTKSFVSAFKNTQLYKKLKQCQSSLDLDEENAAEFARDSNKANIEVWISRWSHELTKVKINGSDNGANYDVSTETTWDEPFTIDIPKDVTPWQKVIDEYEKMLQTSLYGAPTEVESANTFRFL